MYDLDQGGELRSEDRERRAALFVDGFDEHGEFGLQRFDHRRPLATNDGSSSARAEAFSRAFVADPSVAVTDVS